MGPASLAMLETLNLKTTANAGVCPPLSSHPDPQNRFEWLMALVRIAGRTICWNNPPLQARRYHHKQRAKSLASTLLWFLGGSIE